MRSKAGDWVEVRSKEEILASLDANGRLEGMPFMPEMLAYCGKRMRVHMRAHKGCDTIEPIRMRALKDGVMLDGMRCDGAAHGGCQAQCTVMWKEAWLKPVNGPAAPAPVGEGCTEEQLDAATRGGVTPTGMQIYRCQATDFPDYTTQLRTRNVGQFIEDIQSRNFTIGDLLMSLPYFIYDFIFRPEREKGGEPFRRFYDKCASVFGLVPYPRRHGLLENGAQAPVVELNLQPGELVRVRSYDEIMATLGKDNFNRGMMFDGEMVPFCGGAYRVRSRVENFLDERTGVMRTLKTPAVILEGVWCRSRFSNRRLLCPRAIYSWWREAWLERAPEGAEETAECLGARHILKNSVQEGIEE